MTYSRALLSVALLSSIIIFSGCGGKGGNPEPLTDKQFGLLSKTWKVKSSGGVLFGSNPTQVDSTSHWTNFKLTIGGTKGQPNSFTYSCTCRPPRSAWPASGTWAFGSDPTLVSTQIIRDPQAQDALNITYTVDATSQNLQLQFTFTGKGYTRVSNVTGDWTFNLVPQ